MGKLRQMPGEFAILEHGTPVRVDFSLGEPYIDGILPLSTKAPVGEPIIPSITGTTTYGGNDPTHDRNFGVTARAAGEPVDLMPGDQAIRSEDGANIAALRGKVAQIFGSELANIRAFGDTDQVTICAGLFRLLTWMGEASYTNDEGKTSFSWRGGSDQLTQTGVDEEKYTVRLDVGHIGGIIRLEVTTPDGQPVFRFHVDPAGHGELFFAGGLDQHVGRASSQSHPMRFHGTREVEVEGQDTIRVSGEVTHQYEAGKTVEVSNDDNHTVGQDLNLTVNRNENISIGGRVQATVHGPHKTVVTSDAMLTEVQGSGDFGVTVQGGNIDFTPTAGAFRVRTAQADKIEQGTDPTSHGTKYEELETALNALVQDYNTFKALVKSHVHGTTSGPTDTSIVLATVVNFLANWRPAKSLVVKLL